MEEVLIRLSAAYSLQAIYAGRIINAVLRNDPKTVLEYELRAIWVDHKIQMLEDEVRRRRREKS